MQRILVTLVAGSDRSAVVDGLRAIGADRLAEPRAQLPDVLVADFDDTCALADLVEARVRCRASRSLSPRWSSASTEDLGGSTVVEQSGGD